MNTCIWSCEIQKRNNTRTYRLVIWKLPSGSPVALLCCGGHFAGMVWIHLSQGHFKSVQSCSEWSSLSYDDAFLSWWEWTKTSSIGHEGSLNSLMSMEIKWIMGYGIYSSHQLNTYERFWTNMLNCILNHHQNTNVLESSDQTHLNNLTKVFRNTW